MTINITPIDIDKLPQRRKSDAQTISDTLTAQPGQWFEVTDAKGINTNQINKGLHKAFKPVGAFEAFVADKKIFARFTEQDQTATEAPAEEVKAPRVRKTKAQRDAEKAAAAEVTPAPESVEAGVVAEESK
jgi:FKBP-type peptidyl-prolyl cis-trans isomerase